MKRFNPVWVFSLFSLAFLLGMFVLQLALVDSASAAQAPQSFTVQQTLNARLTQVAITATALKQHLAGTATALAGKLGGTATVRAANIFGTATALAVNINNTFTAIVATANAVRTHAYATGTALAGTATAVRGNISETATAVVGTLQAIKTKYSVTLVPAEEAKTVLSSYASVLGISATFTNAIGYDATMPDGTNLPLPSQLLQAQVSATNLAAHFYLGKTATDGESWIAYGDAIVEKYGLVGILGDSVIKVQNASLGTFAQSVTANIADANAALALAKSTYPALAGFTYVPATVSKGYGFYSNTYTYVVDPASGQVTLTPQSILLAVQPVSGGKVIVSAGVGRGEFSTTIHP